MEDNQCLLLMEIAQNQIESDLKNIERHEDEINDFVNYCRRNVSTTIYKSDLIWADTIGVLVNKKNILHHLLPSLPLDKEGLVAWSFLEKLFVQKQLSPGYFSAERFIFMVHHYFRRGMYFKNNWYPSFIESFWKLTKRDLDIYLALDLDRVKVGIKQSNYFERDKWYGSSFNRDLTQVKDGVVKLCPPNDVNRRYLRFLFADTYSVDIKWSTKGNIRTFQSIEFKEKDVKVELDNLDYHPARYMHAEFDLTTGLFRHFDGAVQHFTEAEYETRKDQNFNFDSKQNASIKAISKKLFKINGGLPLDDWAELCSHFYYGNPLMYEYFNGHLPEDLLKRIEIIRNAQN